jgi:glycosyltransferase involved in cell wall biosynthesis
MSPRILIIQTQGENAGAQEISRLVGAGLGSRGYDVSHLFFYRKSPSFDAPPNTRYCSLDRPRGLTGALAFPAQLLREIRAAEPDVILTFQHYGNTVGGLAARLACSAPIIANQVSARMLMNPLVRSADLMLGLLGAFDLITVNSSDMLADYSRYPKRYGRRLRYVPHGFDLKTTTLSRQQARASFGLPPDVPLLGSVARLNAGKRLDAAICALTDSPDWHLVLAGQGPDEMSLRQLVVEKHLETRVYFTGEVPPERIGDFLAALDVFVFPSQAETFGLAAVEAAAAGVPVVANDLPVLREVLASDGRPAALFVDAADHRAFTDAISRALHDDALRTDLISAGRGLHARYSVARMVDDYEQLLRSLIAPAHQLAPQP